MIAGEGAENFLDVTAERYDLLLLVNDYKMCKESFERKQFEQDVNMKKKTASVKHLEEKLSSLQIENVLVEKDNDELMRSYAEQKTVWGRSVKNLVKIVPTRFFRILTCISRAISKRCLTEIPELEYIRKDLRRNRTAHSD